ncbi:hypothetical protein ACROYT_G035410, partial [Oculina patagonica]
NNINTNSRQLTEQTEGTEEDHARVPIQSAESAESPTETTGSLILRRILTPENIFKGFSYCVGGYIVLKTFQYATNTSLPLDDRERTVKTVCSLLTCAAYIRLSSETAQISSQPVSQPNQQDQYRLNN